jgi:Holliday junction resolvase RusA-like endonuclease
MLLPLGQFDRMWTFYVAGVPVPWSTPDVGTGTSKRGKRFRFAKKNEALTAWQDQVNAAARVAYGPFEPCTGPIALSLVFLFATEDESLRKRLVEPAITWNENQAYHKKQGGFADRTNLIKGVEDALQGVFFVNDTQVRMGHDICIWERGPGVLIAVYSLKPGVIKWEGYPDGFSPQEG